MRTFFTTTERICKDSEPKNVPAFRHNLIRIGIANRYCVLLTTLASGKVTRMKWQTCSNGILTQHSELRRINAFHCDR